ncbi:MAG: zinc ribbon domain-containing protein [Cyanobacteria bacterium J06628_6]
MPSCPRCQQSVSTTALECPNCRLMLKAHGHPGIPLHRATEDTPLCETCTYHFDDTCTFPQRPHARTCTLYQDQRVDLSQSSISSYQIPWWRKYSGWIALGLLILASLLITVL